MSVVMPVFYDALLSQPRGNRRKLRIMLRSREQLDAKAKTAMIKEVDRVVQQHVNSRQWQEIINQQTARETIAEEVPHDTSPGEPGQVTGYYVIMADLINQLVQDQWRCLVISSLLILLLLWLATGSVRLAFVALVPNVLPAFLVLSLVGYTGGKINMGAAMIAAVSVGLSIDGRP